MSALTLLVPNDVPGLQVWKDGNWVAVNYLPNALFVHVGDQLEVLSNGKYKSVLHRSLVNKKGQECLRLCLSCLHMKQ
ncbi:Flavonol synthase/flavanone 3-hydroxylase [Camellia lanceoleosa]|uniref:Flavonol synthase/flavanone 3-hydroxylase n=1 Tax=Camellia lanceoleosa TaxID=1840588 RepID=A0ACC0HV35_9ERIC|nr:Flavonol synthase/flavanone 3-hydroxylase [Camellia lanceoleosa]